MSSGRILGPVLDGGHAQVGETLEDGSRRSSVQQVVPDGLLDGERLDRRLPSAREGGGEPVHGVAVGGDPAVGGMDHDGDARLVGQPPEAVEHRVERAASAERGGGSGRPHDHGAGAVVEGPGELLDGPGRIGQGEVGGGVDPVPVVEGPVLQQPAVEGPEQVADGLGVVGERLLVDHAEGGEEEAAGQALLVQGRRGGPRAPGRPAGSTRGGPGTPSGCGCRDCPGSSRTWPRAWRSGRRSDWSPHD